MLNVYGVTHDAPWNSSLCNDPPPEKQPRHAPWLAYVGVAVAVCGSFICSLALLIGKRSADVESGWPLLLQWRWPPVILRRKRWWAFFIINTGSDVLLSSLALSLAPLSQIAPCSGLAVIFSALLARIGCVPGVREQLSVVEWLALGVTLAGLVATFLAAGSLLVLLLSRGGPAAIPSGSLRSVATACVVTALVEAFTDQLDNIFLPIVFMASL